MFQIPQYLNVDGYKLDHISQYVEGTNKVYSNLTARSFDYVPNNKDYKMTVLGVQFALIKLIEAWDTTFFNKDLSYVIDDFVGTIAGYLGAGKCQNAVDALVKLHNLGYLPLEVRAIDEGVKVPEGTPIFTITNTLDGFAWLPNGCETFLSQNTWPFLNAGMVAKEYRSVSSAYAEKTGADPFWVNICNHNFGARGMRGDEDAMVTGMAHLMFGIGSDTVSAIPAIEHYYYDPLVNSCLQINQLPTACSVAAAEHATATQNIAWERKHNKNIEMLDEYLSLKRLITEVYPTGIFSYVADSEDYFRLIGTILLQLKSEILARENDATGMCKLVIRPDSSLKTPLEVILGDPEAEDGSFEQQGSLQVLWNIFGGTVNDKGFKVLNPKIGLIYGEAITPQLLEKIYQGMMVQGFCVSNLLTGVGSWGFLKESSRDTHGIAMKGTSSEVNGVEVPMQKNPKTADSFKKSAKGYLKVVIEDGEYVTHDEQTYKESCTGELKLKMVDGLLKNPTSISEIRSKTFK